METSIVNSNDSILSKDEDIECCCPICLRTSMESGNSSNSNNKNDNNIIQFVYSTTCGHIFCLPCIEQILLSPLSSLITKRTNDNTIQERSSSNNNNDNNTTPLTVNAIYTTTQGICPLCRAELSYFDLNKIYIHTDEKSSNTNNNECSLKYNIIKSNESILPSVSNDDDEDVMETTRTLPKELNGKVYQSNMSSTYIQFPKDDHDDENNSIQLFISNNDNSFGTIRIHNQQYLSKTHTVKGWGNNTKTDTSNVEYCIWMTFSDNFHFITHGVCRIIERNRTTTSDNNNINKNSNDKSDLLDPNNESDKVYVLVYGGNSGNHMIRVTNPTTDINDSIPEKCIPYNSNTYWGNIYCQSFKIGLASYHFIRRPNIDGETEISSSNNIDVGVAYISYEHVLTSSWLPLDNGRPIPSRVVFRNITCPDQYTFCGSICWEEDYNTTWHGNSRWDYTMKFDADYMCIIAGTVKCVKTNRNKVEKSQSQQVDNNNEDEKGDEEDVDAVEQMSNFGIDLIYINAGLYNGFIENNVLLHSGELREINENDDPLSKLKTIMNCVLEKCQSISDLLILQRVSFKTAIMLMHILKAATHTVHNKLLKIVEDLPHQNHNNNLSAILGEVNEAKNPIDMLYYFE